MAFRKFCGTGEQRAGRGNDAAIVRKSLDYGQQWGRRLGSTPGSNRNVRDLIASEIEGGECGAGVSQEGIGSLVMSIVRVESRQQDAGVEQQRGHGAGRVAFTRSATVPP